MKRNVLPRILSAILAVLMLACCFPLGIIAAPAAIWDGSVASGFDSGTGTVIDPYIIKTAGQLAYLASTVNSGTTYNGKYIKLADDIALNDTANWRSWETDAPANTWTAIGNYDYVAVDVADSAAFTAAKSTYGVLYYKVVDGEGTSVTYTIYAITDTYKSSFTTYCYKSAFCGTFDGNGHTVSGLYSDNDLEFQGLFGAIQCGTILNLGVIDSYISGKRYVGGVVGYTDGGTIANCFGNATVRGTNYVGGVTGGVTSITATYIIRNCYSAGIIRGSENVGGVAGCGKSDAITNCYYIAGYATDGNNTAQHGIGSSASGSVPDVTGGTAGFTDEEMKLEATYTGFDFRNVWAIEPGTGYAYPRFMKTLDKSFGEPSAIWDGSVAAGFEEGAGTEEDPYIIKTAGQLAYLASTVNSGTTYNGKYIKLANDITLNDSTAKHWILNASEWTAIGRYAFAPIDITDNASFDAALSEHGKLYVYWSGGYISRDSYSDHYSTYYYNSVFCGVFDGDGHTVAGVYVNGAANGRGLFGSAETAKIMNLGVVDSYISGGNNVGAVVGTMSGGTLMNCFGNATVEGTNHVGGVVGFSNGGAVMNCYGNAAVTGANCVGGVTGYTVLTAILDNCSNYGSVFGTKSYIGGIAGNSVATATVDGCCNYGAVFGAGMYVGGIAGYAKNHIGNCYNTGDIAGSSRVGGITGYQNAEASVSNCYNTGNITGSVYAGGVAGRIASGSTVTDCYYLSGCAVNWNKAVQFGIGNSATDSATADISGSTAGLDGAEMKAEKSYAGFDFENIWTINNGEYPTLWAEPANAVKRAVKRLAAESISLSGEAIRLTGTQGLRMSVQMKDRLRGITIETDGYEVLEYGLLVKAAKNPDELVCFDNGDSLISENRHVAKSPSFVKDAATGVISSDFKRQILEDGFKFSAVLNNFPEEASAYMAEFAYRGYVVLYNGTDYINVYTGIAKTSIYRVAMALLAREYSNDLTAAPEFIGSIISMCTAESDSPDIDAGDLF